MDTCESACTTKYTRKGTHFQIHAIFMHQKCARRPWTAAPFLRHRAHLVPQSQSGIPAKGANVVNIPYAERGVALTQGGVKASVGLGLQHTTVGKRTIEDQQAAGLRKKGSV